MSAKVQGFLYLILTGIVQGCPSAGLLFAIAADPFFQEFLRLQSHSRHPRHKKVTTIAFRGCADDIGAALASYKLLILVKPIFVKAEFFAGLKLGVAKCVIIPTAPKDNFCSANLLRN